MKRFEHKVAFITGGNSGIGRASAILIAREGAKVMIADLEINQDVLEEIRKEGSDVDFVKCDVSNPEDVERAIAETVLKFGSLDIALNNAGISDRLPIHEKSIEEWKKVIQVNLDGLFYGLKYQIAQMRKQAGGGSIINIGSVMSQVTEYGNAAYTSSKHAVVGITKTAALENGTNNIRVNAIGPGFIDTPLLTQHLDPDLILSMESRHALKRLGKVEEIAKAFLFLASDDASFCTGAFLPVDGGYLIQ